MKAKYYRYLFHKVTGGLCYSGCITNEMDEKKESFCFLYLAGGEEALENETSYAVPELRYDLVVLGDLSPAAVKRACTVTKHCQAKEILIPDGSAEQIRQITEELGTADAGVIHVVKEEKEMHHSREYLRILPAKQKNRNMLLLYHADEGAGPEKEECILTIKPMTERTNCCAKADHDTFTCEMRCMLYNDFMLCKRHNRRESKAFLDGYLLFPSAKAEVLERDRESAASFLSGKYRNRIRFFGTPDKDLTSEDLEETEIAGKEKMAVYLIGTEDTPAEVIKTAVTGDPYRHFFAAGEHAGLCISGYYVPRK